MTRLLDNLFVLEFGSIFAGPYCTQFLADMGADVLKIERLTGAVGRNLVGNYRAANRNKESFSIDLRSDRGRELGLALAAQADVLVENYRPGAMQRLGFGYQALSELNPRLVYCALSGYGSRGPWQDLPGQDLLIQAASGTR